LKSIGALRSEQFGLAFVEFDLAYRKFGAALVEQVFDQINRTRWANSVATHQPSAEAPHGIALNNRRSHSTVRRRRILGSRSKLLVTRRR
jgi:hypothetical protein